MALVRFWQNEDSRPPSLAMQRRRRVESPSAFALLVSVRFRDLRAKAGTGREGGNVRHAQASPATASS